MFLIAGDFPKLTYLTTLDLIILTTFMLVALGVAEFVWCPGRYDSARSNLQKRLIVTAVTHFH
jgi:hypothetical protein